MSLRIIVAGACGRMGQEVIRTIACQPDMELAAAVDRECGNAMDIGLITENRESGIKVTSDLIGALSRNDIHCLVDFTRGSESPAIIREALKHRVPCVVGTTGIMQEEFAEIEALTRAQETPVLLVPNFSLGGVLMMKFATMAARYFNHAEIIELHHDRKLDAPSGTALRTAALMTEARSFQGCETSSEKLPGVRGGDFNGIHMHAVRLPGMLAHQEVILGGEGEILTIRHDSMARSSFMPGVMLAIREVRGLTGLVTGLEHVMEK